MTRDEVVAILKSTAGRDESRKVRNLGRAVAFVERAIFSGSVSRLEAEQMIYATAKIAY